VFVGWGTVNSGTIWTEINVDQGNPDLAFAKSDAAYQTDMGGQLML